MNSYSRRRAPLNTGVSPPARQASTTRRLALRGLYAAATSTLVSSTTRVTAAIGTPAQAERPLPCPPRPRHHGTASRLGGVPIRAFSCRIESIKQALTALTEQPT